MQIPKKSCKCYQMPFEKYSAFFPVTFFAQGIHAQTTRQGPKSTSKRVAVKWRLNVGHLQSEGMKAKRAKNCHCHPGNRRKTLLSVLLHCRFTQETIVATAAANWTETSFFFLIKRKLLCLCTCLSYLVKWLHSNATTITTTTPSWWLLFNARAA